MSNKKTEELNIQESLPELKKEANDSSAALQRLIIEMERFDNDQIQSGRRKQELDDLISTTNLQLKREIQILEDINNNVIGNNKDIIIEDSEIAFIPENTVEADLDTSLKVFKLLESLEELDDTQTVTSNVDFSDEMLEHLD